MILGKYKMLKGHRLLWKWLYNNPRLTKSEWPGWQCPEYKNFSDYLCFPCYYADKKLKDRRQAKCIVCPIDWKTSTINCCCLHGGLYIKWVYATCVEHRMRLAYEIATRQLNPYPNRSLAWWNQR